MNNKQTPENVILEWIDGVRRAVMGLYGGNLDHPALDHLEAAMAEVRHCANEMAARGAQ